MLTAHIFITTSINSQPQVHFKFCLSNGRSWIFCILTKDGSCWVYYESSAWHLKEEGSVAKIMELVSEWVSLVWLPVLVWIANLLFLKLLTPMGESELYQLID